MDNVNTHCCAYQILKLKMKIKITTYILAFTTLVVLQSCCSKENLVDMDYANFLFKEKASGKNLFGLNSSFSLDSVCLKYYSTDSFHKISYAHSNLDSTIRIDFNLTNELLVRFSNNDVDTFIITYNKISSKTSAGQCKLTASIMNSLKFNGNIIDISNLQNPIIIYK